MAKRQAQKEIDKPMTRAENALEHALAWWETIQSMAQASGGRGIEFAPGYEPSWIQEARAARKALQYIAAAMESGSLSEIDWGIYENIKLGFMECDETGRQLRLTQAGLDEVRSLG